MQKLSNVRSNGKDSEDLMHKMELTFQDSEQNVRTIAKTAVNEKDRIHSQSFWDRIANSFGDLKSLMGELRIRLKKKIDITNFWHWNYTISKMYS